MFALLGIIAGGVLIVVLTDFSRMKVSADSLWNKGDLFALPPLSYPSNYNEEEWYKLKSDF